MEHGGHSTGQTHGGTQKEQMGQRAEQPMQMAHGQTGHSGMGMMHMGNLRRRFFVCLALALPVLFLSPMMGVNLPFQFSFPGSGWVVVLLCSILYFYGGKPFMQGAKEELKNKSPAMMTLITLGITVAYFYSLYAFVRNTFLPAGGHVMDFFWELATLVVIMLLGHWVEMRAVAGAGDALQSMAKLLPGSAHLVADGSTRDIPLGQLQVGQRVLVKAGEKIPADGTVVQGSTSVNEAMVTGEAKEVPKQVGNKVIGGSVNGNGTLTVQVTGTGESGFLAQVMQLVGSAQQSKSRAETLSDRVARWLFYVATVAGVLAFIAWFVATGSADVALARMVTVLVIACPHALGLAIPLVVARATSLGARHGLLVKRRQALETAARVTVVMLDKTGTLTEGRFKVTAVQTESGACTQKELLAIMGPMERTSGHPLAKGIVQAAEAAGAMPKLFDAQVRNVPGTGLEATLQNGQTARIVNASYLDKNNIPYNKQTFMQYAWQGYSVSYLVLNGTAVGLVAQGDTPKPEARQLVAALHKMRIAPIMLTGDNEESAKAMGKKLGIGQVHAGLLPEDKQKIVGAAQQKKAVVMMVGDGVNDAPSLAKADVGVAIGAGTDVAMDSADVVLVRSALADISAFLRLARSTTRKMRQNLFWGAGYNVVAIPLAAGVLAPFGILLSPAAGAVLMSLSTIIVAANAMLLRLKKD